MLRKVPRLLPHALRGRDGAYVAQPSTLSLFSNSCSMLYGSMLPEWFTIARCFTITDRW